MKWKKGKREAKLPIGPILVAHGLVDNLGGAGRTTVRCPYHDDRSPSATVDEDEGWYHCHVCGIHEDAIGLIRMRDGSSFNRAVEEAEALVGGKRGEVSRKPKRTILSRW